MRKSICWILAGFCAGAAFAATQRHWKAGVEGDYTEPLNWVGDSVPGRDEAANIDGGGKSFIREGMDITIGYLNVARTNVASIVQSGGRVTLTATTGDGDGGFKVGRGENDRDTGAVGIYDLAGGTLSVPTACVEVGHWGHGTLNICGGRLETAYGVVVALSACATGALNITDGGFLQATDIALKRTGATMSIDNGTVRAFRRQGTDRIALTFLSGAAGTCVEIGNGGAVFDTDDIDCLAGVPLVAADASTGGIEKRGAGKLRLTKVNTYAGPTLVSEGSLFAQAPSSLPGYDVTGRVTVRSGARLVLGLDWTQTDVETLRAHALIEEGALIEIGVVFDTTSGDRMVSEDIISDGAVEKLGAGTLFLTGHNLSGGDAFVRGGTLQADFGQGLDADHAVVLCGGSLSSASGSITAPVGAGAGEISVSAGYAPGFTAKNVPLTVNLWGDGRALTFGSTAFPANDLKLNSAEANAKLTFANGLDLNGKTVGFQVSKNLAEISGDVTDGPYVGTLEKQSSGTLALTGSNRVYRLNLTAGTVLLDGAGAKTYGVANVRTGSTLLASNQTVSVDNNFNVMDGIATVRNSAMTVKGLVQVGYDDTVATVAKRFTLDGGSLNVKNSVVVGLSNAARGEVVVTNDATVTADQVLVGGGAVFRQSSGMVHGKNPTISFMVGNRTKSTGEYVLENGLVQSSYHFQLGTEAASRGIYRQCGGTNTVLGLVCAGWHASGTGEVYVTGGVLQQPVAKNFRIGENGTGYMEVSEKGLVKCGDTALNISGDTGNSGNGRIVLRRGGMIEAPKVYGNGGNKGRYSEFFFDGGTLKATAQNSPYLYGLTAFAVGPFGGIVDTNGRNVRFDTPMTARASTGGGASSGRTGGLLHRWSFNGDLTDSVTGESATAEGHSFMNGAVSLKGGARGNSCVNLGSNILPKDGSGATIELWATQRKVQDWSRMFEIGRSGTSYICMTWVKGTEISQDMVRIYSTSFPSVSSQMAPYTLDQEFHIAMTFKPLSSGNWQVTAYKQDAVTGRTLKKTTFETSGGWSLTTQDQTYCYLGRTVQVNNDASADYNEVRVWDRCLEEEELTANAEAGPDHLPDTAFVKTGAGTLTLSGANTYAVDTRVAEGTLALATGASLPSATSVELVEGAGLDLGGAAQTVAGLSGSGLVTNGTLTATDGVRPGGTDAAGTLTLADATLCGTAEIDFFADGTCDRLVCAKGAFDASGLSLRLAGTERLVAGTVYTLVESTGGVTGRFVQANVPNGWNLSYGARRISLSRAGCVVFIR